MTPLPCLILAAGFGTRMRPLTDDLPKALIEVAGRPLIDHARAAVVGAAPIYANAHHHAAQLRDHLRTVAPEVRVLEETPRILDSGGAVKNLTRHTPARHIATMNADAVWRGPPPLRVLQDQWRAADADALMLLVPRARAHGRTGGGDVACAADGALTWDKGPDALVYTGLQILDTTRFAGHPEDVFSMREIWDAMQAEGRLRGVIYPGHWADVGHPGGIAIAEAMLRGDDGV